MALSDAAFEEDLDLVTVRLARITDDVQLAGAIEALLPKLLLMLDQCPAARRAKVVQVLNSIRQWSSECVLPVERLIAVHELGPTSFAAPFTLVFLEQAVQKTRRGCGRKNCCL